MSSSLPAGSRPCTGRYSDAAWYTSCKRWLSARHLRYAAEERRWAGEEGESLEVALLREEACKEAAYARRHELVKLAMNEDHVVA